MGKEIIGADGFIIGEVSEEDSLRDSERTVRRAYSLVRVLNKRLVELRDDKKRAVDLSAEEDLRFGLDLLVSILSDQDEKLIYLKNGDRLSVDFSEIEKGGI